MRNLQEGTAAAGCGMEQIIPLSGLTKVIRVAAVGSCPATSRQPDDCTWISKLAPDTVVYIVLFAECKELQSSCTYVYCRHVTSCGKRNSIADRDHSWVTYSNDPIRKIFHFVSRYWDHLFRLNFFFFLLFFSILRHFPRFSFKLG